VLVFVLIARYSFQIFMKLEFFSTDFRRMLHYATKFHENPSSGWRVFFPCGLTDGQTDLTKRTVPFRNFANAPINRSIGSTKIETINLAVLPISFKTDICFYSVKTRYNALVPAACFGGHRPSSGSLYTNIFKT